MLKLYCASTQITNEFTGHSIKSLAPSQLNKYGFLRFVDELLAGHTINMLDVILNFSLHFFVWLVVYQAKTGWFKLSQVMYCLQTLQK